MTALQRHLNPAHKMRVAIATSDCDRRARFYATGCGIDAALRRVSDSNRALLSELGKATIVSHTSNDSHE